jgi:hypothetical protein
VSAPDVVDAIEAMAANEIAELRKLVSLPDCRLTDDVIERLQKLLEIVTAARKEWRDQRRFVAKLPDEELDG